MNARNTRVVLNQIQFKSGFLTPIVEADDNENAAAAEEAPEAAGVTSHTVTVMRFEPRFEQLLVLCEDDEWVGISEGTRTELSVPTDQTFVTIDAVVARTDTTREGRKVLYLDLTEVEAVQRRNDDRFQTKYFVRFTPLAEWEDKVNLGIEGFGQGQGTDLSLGGMQLLTDVDLPNGFEAVFEIRIHGTLRIEGKVVRRHLRTRLGTTYGVQFLEYDQMTSQRLHRFTLAERRKQRDGSSGPQGAVGRSSEERSRLSRRRREW